MQSSQRETLSLKQLEVPKRGSMWQNKEQSYIATVADTFADERKRIWVTYQWINGVTLSNDKLNREFQNLFYKVADTGGVVKDDITE